MISTFSADLASLFWFHCRVSASCVRSSAPFIHQPNPILFDCSTCLLPRCFLICNPTTFQYDSIAGVIGHFSLVETPTLIPINISTTIKD
ncbi:hypothetical protein K432DRAFT_53425 [Lepidopterella palustris CBS 459.81]|uniref:Secreted protein n=1 Tax=Lepidopterella palustris CBS 459.81 TaxID=1314670 RepID=A0A8E2E9V3_9PEZI|nr:hypothetical protein K432DRAFT_53425 [Lepidopterella palustris CBS 459.81]